MNIDTRTEHVLDQLATIAQCAGRAILAWYDTDMGITHKADDSPLTKADLASHEVIATALAQHWPAVPLLSEESAAIEWGTRRQWSQYWLVDPLDGTKEFISRNGEFTVNIALIRDHRPVLGVVHVPVTGTTFAGAVGAGAWCSREGVGSADISVRRPARVPAVVVGSRSHANPDLAARLEMLGPHELTSMGSSLKFCRIAEGQADFYPRMGPTCEWDTAAAQAVVEAAGGQVVTADGKPLEYNRKEAYLNPHFFVFGDETTDWLAPFRD